MKKVTNKIKDGFLKVCHICGSNMKISTKGKLYCSNICWTKSKYKKLREEWKQYEEDMSKFDDDQYN